MGALMGTKPGATKSAVLKALEKHGVLTATEIADRSGVAVHSIRVCIGAMITRYGGVCRVGKRGHEILYGVPGRDDVHRVKVPRVNVAGPRYVGDWMTTLSRDPFEHRRLALAGR